MITVSGLLRSVLLLWEVAIMLGCVVSVSLLDRAIDPSATEIHAVLDRLTWVTTVSIQPVHAVFGTYCFFDHPTQEGVFVDWSPMLVLIVLEWVRHCLSD
jgi:hypothetical protein